MKNKESWFANSLIEWFTKHGRTFPWRETVDPYAVLIAEKLLQQTSVRQDVIRIYKQLLHEYPTPQQLSQAQIKKIRTLIQPLGLHYRADDLVQMSKDICEKYNNIIPSSLPELLSIYGVGDYSARAVLSFAFDMNVAVVDTNVARILYRVFDIQEKFPQNPARSRKLIGLAQELVPEGNSKKFNWAMIDLGSLICLPRNPHCYKCPLNSGCNFYKTIEQ